MSEGGSLGKGSAMTSPKGNPLVMPANGQQQPQSLAARMAVLEKELAEQQQMLRTIVSTIGISPNRQLHGRVSPLVVAPPPQPQPQSQSQPQPVFKVPLSNYLGAHPAPHSTSANSTNAQAPVSPIVATTVLSSAAQFAVPIQPGSTPGSRKDPDRSGSLDNNEKTFLEKTKDKMDHLVRDLGRIVGVSDSMALESESEEDEELLSASNLSGKKGPKKAKEGQQNPLNKRTVNFDVSPGEGGLEKKNPRSLTRQKSRRMLGAVVSEHATYHAEHPAVVCIDTTYAILVTTATIIAINSFSEPDLRDFPSTYIPVSLGLFQVFFGFWMYTRLFIRYRDNDWNVVDTSQLIRRHYARTTFMFDLALTIPIEFLFLGWLNMGFRILCARHFLRWLRLYSLGKSSNPLIPARSWFYFFIVFCLIVTMTHAFTKLFQSINVGSRTVVNVLTNSTSIEPVRSDYLTALYNIIATVTSVGYGDFVIHSDSVRVLLIAVMIFGVSCIATFSAFATKFLTHQDLLAAEMNEKKRKMHSMLRYYGIPWELQREVISMFPSVLEADNEQNLKKCLTGLPQAVMSKIDKYLRVKLLRQTPIFTAVSSLDALGAVADMLEAVNFDVGMEVVRAGTVGDEMYIIVQGVVEVSVAADKSQTKSVSGDREILAFLYPGQFFGEIALLQDVLRTATVTSVTSCSLLSLSKVNFDTIMTSYPDVHKIIVQEMQQRMVKNGKVTGDMVLDWPQEEAAEEALRLRPGRGLSFTVSASARNQTFR